MKILHVESDSILVVDNLGITSVLLFTKDETVEIAFVIKKEDGKPSIYLPSDAMKLIVGNKFNTAIRIMLLHHGITDDADKLSGLGYDVTEVVPTIS